MSKYNTSKIYKIISSLGCEMYIGSTYRTINDRFNDHLRNYSFYNVDNLKNYTSSFKLFDKYGIESCSVVLLEEVNVETRIELLQKKAKHIKEKNELCK
jgi:hypothetical protein